MPLREELTRSGDFLFRWRSYAPLLALALVVPTNVSDPRPAWVAMCLAIAMFGISIRVYVAGHVPRGSSGRNTRKQVCEHLNMTGAYSMVRHPLYLGNFFIWLGFALVPRVGWLTLIVVLGFWIYYERIMYAEEEFLRAKFGSRYLQWASTTPAFVPNPRLFCSAGLPFSLRAALRREYTGFFAVIATFVFLEWSRNGTLEPLWMALFVPTLVAYPTLRYLKRRTPWLNVPGR